MTFATFEQSRLVEKLEQLTDAELDQLDFGVIGMDADGIVRRYNATESKMANLSRQNVIGHHLFTSVAPCMNNFMVAQRFEDALNANEQLDVVIDYVLTLRMRPRHVRLRLISLEQSALRYVAVQPDR